MSKKNAIAVALADTYAGVSLTDALVAASRMNKAWDIKRTAGKTESEQKGTLCGYLWGMLQAFPNKAERLASVEAFASKLDDTDGVPTDWRSGSSLASRLADCRTIITFGSKATFALETFQKALKHARSLKAGADDAEASRLIASECEKDPAKMLQMALPEFLKAFADLRAKVPECMLVEFDLGVINISEQNAYS